MSSVTTPVVQDADPIKWRSHLFGLTPGRWKSLEGKSIWITGAGTGYGRCLARALALAGAQIFLTGRRKEKLLETIEEIKPLVISVGNCYPIETDITDPDQVSQACNKVRSMCDALYGLVHCAALPSNPKTSRPLQEDSLLFWNQVMSTNVTAPWALTKSIFPHMLAGGSVRVLFFTSEAGWASTPGFGIYNVSKAALNSLAHSMAEEYASSFAGKDVQINTLVPGEARTEMNQTSMDSPYKVVSMSLILLSHPRGGPNGRFFHRDGRHLQFCYTLPYDKPLI